MMPNSDPLDGVIYPSLTLMIKSSILQCSVTDKENAIIINESEKMKFCMGLDICKPVFGACEQQRRRSACVSAQTDQRRCYSCIVKCHIKSCYLHNFNFLASLCS